MTIAERICATQDTKKMTQDAIKTLVALEQDATDLINEYIAIYGESPLDKE